MPPLQHLSDEGFTEQYCTLRGKEGRLYTDAALKNLPVVSPQHPHYGEWIMRKQSADRLLRYALKRNAPLNILEVGCGNGWLSARLAAANANWQVTGMDINTIELQQAQRVFAGQGNLQFLYGNLDNSGTKERHYDLIIFAASIQYFPSLKATLKLALEHTSLYGEVHIMDSPLYQPDEVTAAGKRTKEYYTGLGFPGMVQRYFHHSILELEPFRYRVLHNPRMLLQRFRRHRSPFYHIAVKNHYL